jgi:YgiT-type zinc finger domain-containing protein
MFPRTIETEEDNEYALSIVNRLMSKGEKKLTAEERWLFRLLVRLIEDFEEKAYPMHDAETSLKTLMTGHEHQCSGTPKPDCVTQTFERRGSPVRVTIRHIPADVCPLCHEVYVSRETGHQLDLLLEPFHGKHGHVPLLPPAEIAIDFAEAMTTLAA